MENIGRKKIKKFIFSGNSVQYPSENIDFISANTQEWKLIRALIAHDPVHWMDGFLIFENWREKEQKGNYLDLFRKITSHAKNKLKKLNIDDITIDHPVGKLDSWSLVPTKNEEVSSNIHDAIFIAKNAKEAFINGDNTKGFDLLLQSYKTWPNAKSLAQALLCTDRSLQSDLMKYDFLAHIERCLSEHKNIMTSALAKITVLGLYKQQGIDEDVALSAVSRWGYSLFDINQALELLNGNIEHKHLDNKQTKRFMSLANQFHEYIYDSPSKDYAVESNIHETELKQLLQKILNCDFVVSAAELTRSYYKSIDYLHQYADMVDECIEEAIVDFIFTFDLSLNNSSNVFSIFCEHLRKYTKICFTKDGVKNIFDSNNEISQKNKKIKSLFEDVTDSQSLSGKIQKIFNPPSKVGTSTKCEKCLNLVKPKINIDPVKEQIILSYKYRWPKELYGRSKEIKALYEFINHPNENLLWWAVVGKGGVGKSRLALELCYELEEKHNWYTGFLIDSQTIEILKTWTPQKPTLIVIDYVYEKVHSLGDCISNYVYENSRKWNYPVRILLLERHADSEALESICMSDPDTIVDNLLYKGLKKSYSGNKYLEIKGIGDKWIDTIVEDIFKRENKKDPPQKALKVIKQFLKEKVRENNPLFAMILAEACAKNEEINNWDIERLLNRQLERTKKLWNKNGIDHKCKIHKKHINLLALATMINGIHISNQSYTKCLKVSKGELSGRDILPSLSDFQDNIYEKLCDNNSSNKLPSMEPDILGEYFILQLWENGSQGRCTIELLTKIACTCNPRSLTVFLTRLVSDFPLNRKLSIILNTAISENSDKKEKTILLCCLAWSSCMTKSFDKAIKYYRSAKKLWNEQNCHNDKEISLYFIGTTLQVANLQIENEGPQRLFVFFEYLKNLWEDNQLKEDDDVARLLIVAVYKMICAYRQAMDNQIIPYPFKFKLHNCNTIEQGNVVHNLSNLVYLIKFYICTGKDDKAIEYYNHLEEIYENGCNDIKQISLKLSKAAFDLLIEYSRNENKIYEDFVMQQKGNYYDDIYDKWYSNKGEMDLLIELSKTAYTLICAWPINAKKECDESNLYIHSKCSLSKYKNSIQVLPILALASAMCSIAYDKKDNIYLSKKYLQKFSKLYYTILQNKNRSNTCTSIFVSNIKKSLEEYFTANL